VSLREVEVWMSDSLLVLSGLCDHKQLIVCPTFFLLQVKEFDSISRLDQWHTTLLLRIKKTIQGDEGDLK